MSENNGNIDNFAYPSDFNESLPTVNNYIFAANNDIADCYNIICVLINKSGYLELISEELESQGIKDDVHDLESEVYNLYIESVSAAMEYPIILEGCTYALNSTEEKIREEIGKIDNIESLKDEKLKGLLKRYLNGEITISDLINNEKSTSDEEMITNLKSINFETIKEMTKDTFKIFMEKNFYKGVFSAYGISNNIFAEAEDSNDSGMITAVQEWLIDKIKNIGSETIKDTAKKWTEKGAEEGTKAVIKGGTENILSNIGDSYNPNKAATAMGAENTSKIEGLLSTPAGKGIAIAAVSLAANLALKWEADKNIDTEDVIDVVLNTAVSVTSNLLGDALVAKLGIAAESLEAGIFGGTFTLALTGTAYYVVNDIRDKLTYFTESNVPLKFEQITSDDVNATLNENNIEINNNVLASYFGCDDNQSDNITIAKLRSEGYSEETLEILELASNGANINEIYKEDGQWTAKYKAIYRFFDNYGKNYNFNDEETLNIFMQESSIFLEEQDEFCNELKKLQEEFSKEESENLAYTLQTYFRNGYL